tara:strand:- start:1353 stop:2036 length:684 start_codon:yes stop_codon:yes gene_type:complete
MVKVVASFKRKDGFSVEDFQSHWGTIHGALAAKLPGLRRYVQNHVIAGAYKNGREPVYDGVAEVWFDNLGDLKNLRNSKELAAVRADEPNFMDVKGMVEIITDDYLIKEGPTPVSGVKNIEFVTRRKDLSVSAFQSHWRNVHGPLGGAIPVVLRYVQSHTRASLYNEGRKPAWDGVALTWFEGTNKMRESATTPEYVATREDEPNFVNDELPFLIAKEKVIVEGPAF